MISGGDFAVRLICLLCLFTENAMVEEKDIIDAYLFLRKENQTIPSEALEFMKEVSLRELRIIEKSRTCFSCKHDGMQGVFKSGCSGCGAEGEYRNFSVKT